MYSVVYWPEMSIICRIYPINLTFFQTCMPEMWHCCGYEQSLHISTRGYGIDVSFGERKKNPQGSSCSCLYIMIINIWRSSRTCGQWLLNIPDSKLYCSLDPNLLLTISVPICCIPIWVWQWTFLNFLSVYPISCPAHTHLPFLLVRGYGLGTRLRVSLYKGWAVCYQSTWCL